MASNESDSTGQPSKASEHIFRIIKRPTNASGPRLGLISLHEREVIETPHYLGNTSRGAIPHIAQDNFRRHTAVKGVYVGLEDCKHTVLTPQHTSADPRAHSSHLVVELRNKAPPPIYNFRPKGGASALRSFTALPDETLLVLGARRVPPIAAPAASSNTNETVSVFTSIGFRPLDVAEYAEVVENLRPDIVVGLGDIPYARALGSKRIEKATDRCIQWLQDHIALRKEPTQMSKAQLFASLLPVSCAKQQYYVDFLMGEASSEISGLGIFDPDTLEDLPEPLQGFPRLALTDPQSPLEVLRRIHLGLDIFILPFIGSITDAGIAFDFSFPVLESVRLAEDRHTSPRSLGTDMWASSHSTDLSPLSHNCQCYACKHHHRAYVHHLLSANEMLAWVLLQIHNHHVIDLFFAGVRQSIARATFEQDMREFERAHQSQFPEKTGRGPRIRGYELKTEGPREAKKNVAPFTTLNNGKEKLGEAGPPPVVMHADVLQQQGFAEKQ